MVGRHYQHNGHEFKQTRQESKGQRSLRASVHGVTELDKKLSD